MIRAYVDDILYSQDGYAGSGRQGMSLMPSCASCASGYGNTSTSVGFVWVRVTVGDRPASHALCASGYGKTSTSVGFVQVVGFVWVQLRATSPPAA